MNEIQKKKIIFVCTGNTCRSPMAEAVCRSELKRLRAEGVEVLSAGISAHENGRLNEYSAVALAENGLMLENFNSTPLSDRLLEEAYAVVCMTERQREALVDRRALDFFKSVGKRGSLGENIHSFYSLAGYEIPDPFGKDLNCYRATFEAIVKAMPVILEKLGLQTQTSVAPTQVCVEYAKEGKIMITELKEFGAVVVAIDDKKGLKEFAEKIGEYWGKEIVNESEISRVVLLE